MVSPGVKVIPMETLLHQRSKYTARHGLFAVLATVFCVWFILLCLAHYLSPRPLWNDEECVFNSIRYFSAGQMFTEKLLNIQVFPRAYLFVIQRFSRLFGHSLQSLRFFSFVCMLGAFALWLRLAGRELSNRLEYLTFVMSWPASAMLIYYSSELKQYSMDVLAGAVFLLFILQQDRLEKTWPSWKYLAVLAVLPAWGLFSYPAFMFAVIVLYNLARQYRQHRDNGRRVLIYAGSLLVFLVISWFFDMRFRHPQAVTLGFGDYFISFASVAEFFKTFQEGTLSLFTKWLVVRPRLIKKISLFFLVFGLLYMFYGFFKNIKKEGGQARSLTTVAFFLFIELFILGALKKYPFVVPRTALFFCPFALFLTVKGIARLKDVSRYLYALVQGGYLVFLFFLALALTRVILAKEMSFTPVIF